MSQAACKPLERQLGQAQSLGLARGDELAHRLVRRAHRHAAADEIFHQGRRVEKSFFQPGGDPLALQLGPVDKFGRQLQAAGQRVEGLEQRRLVFLQVAVVGQRQIFEQEQPCVKAPTTRADLPRISSSTSGLRFCGMIDEPVVSASGSFRKPNSVENQEIHSCAQPLRCTAMSERQNKNSTRKSRSCDDVEAVGGRTGEPEQLAR